MLFFQIFSKRVLTRAATRGDGKTGEDHDPETHLIPLILKVASNENNNIKIFGTDYPTRDGTCIRDYIHVSDLTQAHLLSLEVLMMESKSAIYNLGNSRGYSVREVIELARKVTGHPIPVVETDRRPGDPAILIASSDKIKSELGWKPQYEDLEKIVHTAWRWHQKESKKKGSFNEER